MRRSLLLATGVALAMTSGCERPAAPSRRAPVVLISIDTLRADHLPAYGYRGVTTPAIDALARDSILFENAYAQAPLTLPSHATLLTGLLPTQHGVRDNVGFRLSADHRTIAAELRDRGYATGAAVSTFALRRDRGLAAGFDLYDDDFGPGSLDERSGGETARKLEDFAQAHANEPLFLFLHLYEPHTPYAPPEPFRSSYASRPYDGEIAAADAAIGGFIADLKRRGLYERALVVLVSDHGEGLGDHGEDEHGVFLYRETLRVPLLVKLPGRRHAGQRVAAPVGLFDVFPTIAEAAGVPAAAGRPGLALERVASASAPASRRIYSETLYPRLQLGWSDLAALTDNRWSYIEAPRPELYDLVADPGEKRDLAASLPPPLRSMRAELVGLMKRNALPEKPSSEELEKLGSLGYIRVDPGSATGKSLPDPKDRVRELRQYKELFDVFYSRHDAKAVTLSRAILSANPQILSVWRILATSLDRQGRAAEAGAALASALARKDLTGSPEDLEQTIGQLTDLLSRSGDPASAERTLSVLIAKGVGVHLFENVDVARRKGAIPGRGAAARHHDEPIGVDVEAFGAPAKKRDPVEQLEADLAYPGPRDNWHAARDHRGQVVLERRTLPPSKQRAGRKTNPARDDVPPCRHQPARRRSASSQSACESMFRESLVSMSSGRQSLP